MKLNTNSGSVLSAAVLAGALLTTAGCTVHAGYQAGYYYDPYYHQYYAPAQEDVYITQWEGETHREHRDFARRNDRERREYWQWRHQHGLDRNHDKDHDRH